MPQGGSGRLEHVFGTVAVADKEDVQFFSGRRFGVAFPRTIFLPFSGKKVFIPYSSDSGATKLSFFACTALRN